MKWQSVSFKNYSTILAQKDKLNKLMTERYMIHNTSRCYSLHFNVCRMFQRPDKKPWVTRQCGTICQSFFFFSCYWGLLDKHYITGLIIPRMLRRQKSIPLWPPGQCSCWLTLQLLHQNGLPPPRHQLTDKRRTMFPSSQPLPYKLIRFL